MTLSQESLITSVNGLLKLPKSKPAQLVESLLEIMKKALEGLEFLDQ